VKRGRLVKHTHEAETGSEFDGWAPYYDLIHDGLPGEAEFYVGQAVRIGGNTLELGCGTGRIAIPMAMSGVDVTGVDKSAAMLARCREKLRAVGAIPGKLRLVHADMADFDLGVRFSFIAMAYRTFMHLLTPDAQRRCLLAARRHLQDGGVFILSTWVPKPSVIADGIAGPFEGRFRTVGQYPIPESKDIVVHQYSPMVDEVNQLLIEQHRIQEVDPAGNVLHEVTLPLTRAWTTPQEMNRLVRQCGFRVDAVFGDFDCNPLTEKSTEMVWVLRNG